MADAAEWRLYASKEYCMCGSRVDAHGMGDGHSPVSEWDYYAWQEEEAMTQHTGLPVAGYKPQSDDKVQTVNAFKQDEERIMRKLDALKDSATIDGRWLAIGRTQLEQAFMAINRAVFQPGRVELPEDRGNDLFPAEPANELRAVNAGRPAYYSARTMSWRWSDTDEEITDVVEIARLEKRVSDAAKREEIERAGVIK